MKFKAKKKVNVKGPDGVFVTLKEGDEAEFPKRYKTHPELDVTEKKRFRSTGVKSPEPKAKAKEKKEKVPDFDVNKDGKVDEKDNKLMANHLKKQKKNKGKKNKKK